MELINNYIFYSGGAKGADTIWVNKLCEHFVNPNIIVYRPEHIDQIIQTNIQAYKILDKNYMDVVHTLKRTPLNVATYHGKLVRRDMLQVLHAKAVYAVAPIDTNGFVKGGTGYATTRAIHMGLDVYVFDEYDDTGLWRKWDYNYNKFLLYHDVPILCTNSCCVGSRNIGETGICAIDKCIKKLEEILNNG